MLKINRRSNLSLANFLGNKLHFTIDVKIIIENASKQKCILFLNPYANTKLGHKNHIL